MKKFLIITGIVILVAALLVIVRYVVPSKFVSVVDDTVTLKIGQTAKIGNQELFTFYSVSEDSRCPVDVDCVHAGFFNVILLTDEEEISLGWFSEPKPISGHLVEITGIEPPLYSNKIIKDHQYEITFSVTSTNEQ